MYRWAALGASVSLQLCHPKRFHLNFKPSAGRSGIFRFSGFAQKSTLAGLEENKDF